MNHKKTLFYFESKGVEWLVEYFYKESGNIRVRIYTDGDLYHEFRGMPDTKTVNRTMTHAKEVIKIAKRLNKVRDERDRKINKIIC